MLVCRCDRWNVSAPLLYMKKIPGANPGDFSSENRLRLFLSSFLGCLFCRCLLGGPLRCSLLCWGLFLCSALHGLLGRLSCRFLGGFLRGRLYGRGRCGKRSPLRWTFSGFGFRSAGFFGFFGSRHSNILRLFFCVSDRFAEILHFFLYVRPL